MPDYFLQRKKKVNRIDALCAALFDLWCEEKKRVPLAYLLHCWPLTGHDPVSVKKIADALSDIKAGAGPVAEVRQVEEGLLVSLTDDASFGMFAVGSAEPRPELFRVID